MFTETVGQILDKVASVAQDCADLPAYSARSWASLEQTPTDDLTRSRTHIAGLATTAWAVCVRALRAFIASQAVQIAVAAATGAGAWFADHTMERLVEPAFRRACALFAVVERKRPAAAIEKAAGRLHDRWRSPRRLKTGGYEPRLKTTTDAAWIDGHGTDQVDISKTRYKDLPADRQKENKASASVAVKKPGWNGTANGRRPNRDCLCPAVRGGKEKDRVVVRTALGL